jgi:hydroxyacylglutathione hydrolase
MNEKWAVEKIPILQDNFVYVIHDDRKAIVVDPGEASPVLKYLEERKLHCQMILITHHHSDHVHGVPEIAEQFKCKVCAPAKNKKQLHFAITDFVQDGETLKLDDLEFEVMEMPGHTLGHIAYWVPKRKWLFSGDVLFALGCGRVFEGTFDQMYETLQKFKSLPEETLVFCTHDYYPNNRKFCEQEKLSLSGYEPRLPLELKAELKLNTFLKASTAKEFGAFREKRNHF